MKSNLAFNSTAEGRRDNRNFARGALTETLASNCMKIALRMLIAFSLVIVASGLWQLSHPPFTDSQIAESMVDTWEPSALFTTLLLSLLVVLLLSVAAICAVGGKRMRRLSFVALGSLALAASIQLTCHALLTNRVTQITGQNFGAFYGLLRVAGQLGIQRDH